MICSTCGRTYGSSIEARACAIRDQDSGLPDLDFIKKVGHGGPCRPINLKEDK